MAAVLVLTSTSATGLSHEGINFGDILIYYASQATSPILLLAGKGAAHPAIFVRVMETLPCISN